MKTEMTLRRERSSYSLLLSREMREKQGSRSPGGNVLSRRASERQNVPTSAWSAEATNTNRPSGKQGPKGLLVQLQSVQLWLLFGLHRFEVFTKLENQNGTNCQN